MTAEDFVDVRLSEAGTAAAGEGAGACVRVTGGNYEYVFTPGKTQRMPAMEFRARLAASTHQGKALFEIARAEAPAAKGAKAKQ